MTNFDKNLFDNESKSYLSNLELFRDLKYVSNE